LQWILSLSGNEIVRVLIPDLVFSEDQIWFRVGYRLLERLSEVTKDISIELCETRFSRFTDYLSNGISESFELFLHDSCEKAYFILFASISEYERITLQADVLEAKQRYAFLLFN
jgi:hypothetical protein